MVDPISPKAVVGPTRAVGAVSSVRAAAGIKPKDQTEDSSALGALTRELASAPPVDVDRVAEIRAAIADGTFPILPAKIADRLIAFKLSWNPDEPST